MNHPSNRKQILRIFQTSSRQAQHGNHQDSQLVNLQGTQLNIQTVGNLRGKGQRAEDSAPTSRATGNCRRLLNLGTKKYSELLRQQKELIAEIQALKASDGHHSTRRDDLRHARTQLDLARNKLHLLDQANLKAIPWTLRNSTAFASISPKELAGYAHLLQQDPDHHLER
tara:strand:+ start:254 stop:763 length:510 start_codon:yes stop_codon:yes gene_type:complete